MKKTIAFIITVVFIFSLAQPLVFCEKTDWSDMDLTHKEQKKDSVDWSNIDLVAKKPKPDDGQRDWPGEKTGVCGPIIIHTGKGKDEAVTVVGPSGTIRCVAKDREAVKKIADSAKKVLVDACRWATKDNIYDGLKFDYLKDTEEPLTPDEFLSDENLNDLKILEDKWFGVDLDANYFVSNALVKYPVSGLAADSAMVLQLGLTGQELEDIISKVLDRFMAGYRKDNFFQDFQDMPGVYIIEIIIPRTVQNEEYVTLPNDPLFLKVGKIGGSKKGGLGGIAGGLLKAGGGVAGISIGSSGGLKAKGAQDQWGIRKVGFKPLSNPESAWNIEDGSKKNVIVAVIDSGLDMQHPDGPQYIWTNPKEIPDNKIDDDKNGYIDDIYGWNFIEENNDLTDKKGHGTFVSGIIAAKTNNGIGIAGINPGAQIMVLKVADEKGVANSLNIYRALRYAADNGAKVINISLGDRGISQLEQLGINHAYEKGAFVVVAAGNQADNIGKYGPPAARRAFVVGMLNIEGSRSIITNCGQNLALLAPGEDIYSLHSKDAEWEGPAMDKERLYTKKSGTSFSAPIATGTASLLLAKNPDLKPPEVEDILLATATDLRGEGWDSDDGAGLLNASDALKKSPGGILTVIPTEVIINEKNKDITSVDIFGLIRGDVSSYRVELGNGKKPSKWTEIKSSLDKPAEYGFLARIDVKHLSGSQDNIVRISAVDKGGNTKTAHLLLPLKKK